MPNDISIYKETKVNLNMQRMNWIVNGYQAKVLCYACFCTSLIKKDLFSLLNLLSVTKTNFQSWSLFRLRYQYNTTISIPYNNTITLFRSFYQPLELCNEPSIPLQHLPSSTHTLCFLAPISWGHQTLSIWCIHPWMQQWRSNQNP